MLWERQSFPCSRFCQHSQFHSMETVICHEIVSRAIKGFVLWGKGLRVMGQGAPCYLRLSWHGLLGGGAPQRSGACGIAPCSLEHVEFYSQPQVLFGFKRPDNQGYVKRCGSCSRHRAEPWTRSSRRWRMPSKTEQNKLSYLDKIDDEYDKLRRVHTIAPFPV